jgi:hypothetical protein
MRAMRGRVIPKDTMRNPERFQGGMVDMEQKRNIEHRGNTRGRPIMARWVREIMSLASCGGFVWVAWQAALLAY